MAVELGRARPVAWLAMLSAVAALALPKCPMCLFGYLSLFGVSFGAASALAPALRPVGIVFGALALGALLLIRARQSRARCGRSRSAW